jgi:hypothetical protein
MKKQEAAKAEKRRVEVAEGSSGIGMGLASIYGSPLSRPRSASAARRDNESLALNSSSSEQQPKSPRSPRVRAQSVGRDTDIREEREDAEDGDSDQDSSSAIPIPRQRAGTLHTAIDVPTAAYSSSPMSTGLMSGSAGGSNSFDLSSTPAKGSQSAMLPRRTLAPNALAAAATSAEEPIMPAQPKSGSLALHSSPWTSARPVRPSIIASRSYATMPAGAFAAVAAQQQQQAAAPGGIHPSLMSPTVAFRKSISVRNTVTGGALGGASPSPDSVSSTSSGGTPLSPARLIAPAGSPPLTLPKAMQAHPRGSVMLGAVKEWTSEKDLLGGMQRRVEEEDEETSEEEDNSSRKGVRFSSTHPPLSRQNSRIMKRWKGAIRQIMALAMWAKKRSHSRHASAVQGTEVGVESMQKQLTISPTSPDGALLTVMTPTDVALTAIPAAAGVEKKGFIPPSTLLDYFLVYSLPSASFSTLCSHLSSASSSKEYHGLVSRKQLELWVQEANDSLLDKNTQPEILTRYPKVDRKAFPVDAHWGLFGFPDGARVSLTPRTTQCYTSVMTLADGLALFATYLKFDVPLMEKVPNAFGGETVGNAAGHTMSPNIATSPQGGTGLKFWEGESPAATVGALYSPALTRSSSTPASPIHSSPASSPSALLHPQAYVPQCLVLISHYPQLEVMRAVAQQLFEVACVGGVSKVGKKKNAAGGTPLEAYLRLLCFELPLPIPRRYSIRFRIHRAVCTLHFPGIRPAGQSMLNLDMLFKILNVDNVIGILAAMLTENRLLFHSTSLNILTYSMQCFLQLFFPFSWWYSFVPLLMEDMLDAHEIPQPYMLGVHSSHLSSLAALDSVLIVDLDHDVLRCSVPLTPLPIKEGRELWLNWRRTYERLHVSRVDQVEDVRAEVSERMRGMHGGANAVSPPTSPLLALGNHVSMASHLRRGSFTGPIFTPHSTDTPAGAAMGPPTAIAAVLPTAAFNFDEEIYSALIRFYSELLIGSRKFLFFISNVPFFNAQGFLAARISRDPSSLEFFKAFVASRAFDVYIEEEANPDAYHDFLATGEWKRSADTVVRVRSFACLLSHSLSLSLSVFSLLLLCVVGTPVNRVQQILFDDFGKTEMLLEVPDGLGAEQSAVGERLDLNVKTLQPEEIVQAVVLDAAVGEGEAHQPTVSTPFTSTSFPTSASSPPPRSVWWSSLSSDLTHYDFSSFTPQPRKPKNLPTAPSASEGSFGIGEVFSPNANVYENAQNAPQSSSEKSRVSSSAASSSSSNLTPPNKPHKDASSSPSSSSSGGEYKLQQSLSHIFSSQTLTKDEMKEFTQLLADPKCRRSFSTILAQPKHSPATPSHGNGAVGGSGSSSSLCLTQIGFEQLSTLVKSLLDACVSSKDYTSASLGALDVGNVYYKEDANKNHSRTYLETTLKKHPLWQQIEFWKANLTLALSQRAMKGAPTVAGQQGEKASPQQPPNAAEDEFILQWMISTSHQMTAYSVEHKKIESLMRELGEAHGLKQESRQTIAHFLTKIKEAAQYW